MMLTKDIPLERVILDLVDNSVDGAKNLRPDQNYEDLCVDINASPDRLTVEDNCGGIPINIARNYAFRFGRPPGMPHLDHSVGQFGVGMKRALFKLGTRFEVESTAPSSYFLVKQDVNEWRKHDLWEFRFDRFEDSVSSNTQRSTGTRITVEELHDSVANDFASVIFQNKLAAQLTEANSAHIGHGLQVKLNGLPIQYKAFEIKSSAEILPAYKEMLFPSEQDPQVRVELYAGIDKSSPKAAGWYIICNGRVVLSADRTVVTGWGEEDATAPDEVTIPKYHNQFAMFRGYVFFEAADAVHLPWNTTKTGVDVDAGVFKSVRLQMVTLMRPVIDFLNRLDREKETDETILETAVTDAPSVAVQEAKASKVFELRLPANTKSKPRMVRIQYSKPLGKIHKLRQALHASSPNEVGEKSFDYAYEMECGD